jgi:hypothetical protein
MSNLLNNLERQSRQWTMDSDGRHVQFGDLLDEIVDAASEQFDLFSSDTVNEVMDAVLTNDDGDDRKTVSVAKVREALRQAGL